MTTDSIKLLPVYVDEPTHCEAAFDDEAQVVDVEYIDVSTEQNENFYQEDSGALISA